MYEDLIARLATLFADLDGDERNTGICRALECVRADMAADASCIHLFSGKDAIFSLVPEWRADREQSCDDSEIRRVLPSQVLAKLQKLDIVVEVGAATEKLGVEEKSDRSFLVPLCCHGRLAGILTVDWRKLVKPSSSNADANNELKVLRVVGDLFAGVIEQHRVDESLRKTEKRLEVTQRFEALGQLSGGVAHDVNNLLGAIIGSCDLMSDDLADVSQCQEDLTEIRRAAERAASLVDRVLSFGHRETLKPRVIDLNWAVAGMEKLIGRVVGREIDLVLDLEEGCGFVSADPGQIDQILLNLVVNARDAMSGTGSLTIRVREREIGPSPEAPFTSQTPAGKYVELSVRDSGCGMDEETKSQIFEPFFSTKGRVEGTGLGLANVAEIMRELSGVIGVESKLGVGSTFLVLIPRAEEFSTQMASDDEVLAPTGGSEAVLVVEEERVVRNLLRRTLESEGYLVLEAADDQAAVDIAKSHRGPISVVIADLSLPHLQGLSLVQVLQRQRPEMRALFTSYHSASAVRSQAALDASVEVVEKPFGPLSLSRGVRRAIDGQAGVESANAKIRSVRSPGRRTPMHPRTRSSANHRVP